MNAGRDGAERCHLTNLREVKELFGPGRQPGVSPEERFQRQLEYEELISGLVDGRSPAVTFSRVMEHFGLSHKDLADELMCSDRTVHRWFGSRQDWPTLRSVLMFSVAFCFSMANCQKVLESLNCCLCFDDRQFVEMLLRCYAGNAVEALPYLEKFSIRTTIYE